MITVKLMGGLGNQLFQYAAGRALALHHNTNLKLDTFFLNKRTSDGNKFTFRDYALINFNIPAQLATWDDVKDFYSDNIFTKINNRFIKRNKIRESVIGFDKNITSLDDNVYLEGYWPSEKNFKQFESIIRDDLMSNVRIFNKSLYNEIKSCNSVCVHVRRTDSLTNPSFHPCTLEYYQKAMDLFDNNIKFFVFSDDIAWCKEHIGTTNRIIIVPNAAAIQHFELMRACKHFIISNSTFSWWAAWLSSNQNKIVVCNKQTFLDTKRDRDFIPFTWRKI